MGILYGSQFQTMMPKLHSVNFEGMELIRPMYLIREEAIVRWRDYNELEFIQCACKFTKDCEQCGEEQTPSARLTVKKLIQKLKEHNPDVEEHIFRSVENVNLDTLISYKNKTMSHHFLDSYDKE